MNIIRNLFAATVLTLVVAVPTAQAKEAQPAGPGTCALEYAKCLATGGGFLGCSAALAKCLANGGSSTVVDRRDA